MFFMKSVAKIAQIFEDTKRYVNICTYLCVFLYFNLWRPGYLHIFIYIRCVTCWFSNMGYVDTRQYANIQKHIYWKYRHTYSYICKYLNSFYTQKCRHLCIQIFAYFGIWVLICLGAFIYTDLDIICGWRWMKCCRNCICSDSLYQLLLTSGHHVGKGNMYSSVSLDKMFKMILPEVM